MRPLARRLRLAWQRLRLRAWALRADIRLRRNGGRLVLEAPHGATFHELPLLEACPEGGAGGTFTLRLGRQVDLGRRLIIEVWAGGNSRLEVGDRTRFQSCARVTLRNGAAHLGRAVQVRDRVGLKVDGDLRIGDNVVLGRDSQLHCTRRIQIGSHVGMGERTSVLDSDHSPDGSDSPYLDQPLRVAEVVVGRNVLISANTVILRGTRVGANAVIGAGSVLTGDELPGGWLIAGVPARPVKLLTTAQPEGASSPNAARTLPRDGPR